MSSLAQRRLALLFLGLFLAGTFLDAYHRAEKLHVACPIDGAAAHADEHDHGHASDHAHGLTSKGEEEHADGPHWSPASGTETGGEHAHCGLIVLSLKEAAQAHLPAPALPVAASIQRERVRPAAPHHAQVARIHLAPKQSPPAA